MVRDPALKNRVESDSRLLCPYPPLTLANPPTTHTHTIQIHVYPTYPKAFVSHENYKRYVKKILGSTEANK